MRKVIISTILFIISLIVFIALLIMHSPLVIFAVMFTALFATATILSIFQSVHNQAPVYIVFLVLPIFIILFLFITYLVLGPNMGIE